MHTEEHARLSFHSALAPLSFLTAIFLLNFLSRVIFAPLMPTIEGDLGLTHAEAGSLFLWLSAGYFSALLASGFVSSKLTHRWTILLSGASVGVVLMLVVLTPNVWWMRLEMIGLGMAAGLYLPSGIATITAMVYPRHWGKAVAMHELAPNLSLVSAPFIAELFLKQGSWRVAPICLGALSLAAAAIFVQRGRGGAFPGEAPSPTTIRILAAERSFWLMIILFSLGIGASLGVYTMLPLYLVSELGMDREVANTIVGLSRVSGIFSTFIGGALVDRLGSRSALGVVLSVSGILTVLLGLMSRKWIILPVFMQPLVVVCFFPAGFSAIARLGPSRVRNVAVSLTIPVAFLLGGGMIPALIGVLGEAGSFASGLALVGGLLVVGAALTRLLSKEK
jgi:NNP family nitrate/nitrite transporter-like MFS transporter